jgi:hypothetical protein
MKSPNFFIVKPLNGKRYDNVRQFGDTEFIISSSVEDHTVTNRMAIIQSVPTMYEGPLMSGDIVVVHHNTFRLYYDMNGNEASSWNHFKDDIYLVDIDQIYLYRRNDCEWKSLSPYTFIRPKKNKNTSVVLNHFVQESAVGEMVFIPEDISDEISIGDEVMFKPGSEYEFKIDGDRLYRVKSSRICLVT